MLSAVIPLYNEAESLTTLHAELVAVAEAEGYDLEIIFVDDGSSDGSWAGCGGWRKRMPGSRDSLSPELRQGGGPGGRFRAARGRV